MSFIFITIVLGGTALLSWPLGKATTWAMNHPGKEKGFRYGIESIFQSFGGKMVAMEQDWKQYCLSMLLFNGVMFAVVYTVLSLQPLLPLNSDGKGSIEPGLIFNTVASFTSNTNLQHYSGEVTLSYFSQLFGLMWLQFVSAGTGIAALAALAKGVAGKTELDASVRKRHLLYQCRRDCVHHLDSDGKRVDVRSHHHPDAPRGHRFLPLWRLCWLPKQGWQTISRATLRQPSPACPSNPPATLKARSLDSAPPRDRHGAF